VTGYVNVGLFPFATPILVAFVDNIKAYVGNNSSNTVSIINVATDTVTGYINDVVAPFSSPINIVISPDLQTAYITNPSIGQVNVVCSN
ncbi:MAG TPA: hypothetical protein VGP47_04125, partial [Parachlamydiaceae bacterium]|nr:hypothetical protein [Parachlamydiaceae bacterium]